MKQIIFIIGLFLLSVTASAQTYTMQGTVYDDLGPLAGATVHVKNKVTQGTMTDADGKFSIKAERGDFLVFSYIGYKNVEYLVTEEKKDMEIKILESAAELEEVIVTAHGTQRKISSLAAVTALDVKELQQPVSSIANLLGGRVAGVISMQTSGEPGKNIAEFWVRGIGTFGANSSALVLIDGLEGDINTIDPADIESFSVLKDASATAVYGVRGANGVILVTTKRGEADRLQITGRASFTISHIKRLPEYLRAYDYASLANEARSVRGEEPLYTNVEMDIIQNGLDKDLYPDMDWQNEVMRQNSLSQKYYVSARGGAQAARYFVSLGTSIEDAAYIQDKKSLYSSNVGYNTYNYRTNVDLDLTSTTSVYFGSDGFLSVHNEPGVASTDYIWWAQSQINPLLLPAQYSNGQYPAVGVGAGTSPYVMINAMGRRSSQVYKGKATLELKQDLKMITEGLKIRAQGAYDIESYFSEARLIQPSMYEAVGRTQQGELVTIERVQSSAATYIRGTDQYRKYHFESTLSYDRVFAEDHRTSALLYYYMSDQKKASEGTTNMNSIPKRYQGISSRLTYGFRDTYMVDFNFGYTGSENFEPGNQFGFFPSIALGWIPSNYEFVKQNLPFINMLKFRGSLGTVGQDRLAGDRRFPYLTIVSRINASAFGSYPVEGLVETFTGADNLLWEKSTKLDLGIEAQLFKEKVSFVIDFFKDKRDGIFQQRVQVPYYVGLSTMPYSNVGSMESYGADGNASFSHNFNKDMGFTVRGNFTFSKNNVKNWEEANPKYPYQEVSGYPLGVIRGYQALGLFKDQHDIDTSPVQTFGTVMPGDIKYRDVNGDGRIDSDDVVPLSYGTYPLLMFGLGGEFRYKQFSIGVLFKGTGKTDFYHVGQDGNGMGYVPFYEGKSGNVLTIVNDPSNRWIPMDYAIENGIDPSLAENPNARFPRLQYGRSNNNSQLSDFWKGDSRYLRLQEVTLNYNLKKPFLSKVGINSIDIQLVGSNLILWDKVKIFDPEQAQYNGRVYPIPTTYTLQMYVHF
ncbi:MAG: SusC/RagA family TonB-linked outer membrane protein [Dysgonomonas sp.]